MPYRWTLTDLVAPYVSPEVLGADPIGWDEAVYSIKRSETYKGVFHGFTSILKFHCHGGGKEFIDAVYAQDDIDGKISVLVEYDPDGSGTYDTLFEGVIDLSSYTTDGQYTSCKIESSALLTKLFNRDKINVDLSSTVSIGQQTITAPNEKVLGLSGMHIILENEYTIDDVVPNELNFNIDGTSGGSLTTTKYYCKPDILFNSSTLGGIEAPILEEKYEVIELVGGGITELGSITEIYGYVEDLLITKSPLTVTYDILLDGVFESKQGSIRCDDTFEHCNNLKVILAYGDDWDTRTEIVLKDFDTSPGDDNVYTKGNPIAINPTHYQTFNFDNSIGGVSITASGFITLLNGQSVWFYCYYEGEGFAGLTSPCLGSGPFGISREINWGFSPTSYITLTTDTTFFNTEADTVLVHEALNQVIDSIADSDNNFYSSFYGRTDSQKISYGSNGCGSMLAITSGFNIRSFPDKNIFCNLNDLFQSLDALHNIGLGYVNGKIRIEPVSFFYDGATKIITLARVGKYKSSIHSPSYVNKIQIGYQKWETEVRGGLDEPCTKHEYSTTIHAVDEQYNRLSKYNASSYAIELTRRKNVAFQSELEDWRYDNDNFFLALVKHFRVDFIDSGGSNDDIILTYGTTLPVDIGDSITITGSGSNDGTFTITDIEFTGDDMAIYVSQNVVPETNELITVNDIYACEKYIDAFGSGSGMKAIQTAYNLRLTPARMLLSHMNVITAGLQTIRGNIKFVNGDGNTLLEAAKVDTGCAIDYSGEALKENDSIAWNDSNVANITPIWLPELYEFEYPLTYQEFKTIQANPYGYVEFYKFSDDIKGGFILDMEYTMKTGLTRFKLLKRYQ